MAPRKNRPVLFEVIARSQRSRGRTGLIRPAAPVPPTPTPAPSAPSVSPTMARVPPSASRHLPVVRVADGQLHLSLGWLPLVIIGVVLILLLVVAFKSGRRSAQPPAPKTSALENVLAGAPETEPPKPAGAPAGPAPRRSTTPVVTPPGPTPVKEESEAAKPPPQAAKPAPRPQPAALPAVTEKEKEKEKEKPKDKDSSETFSFATNSYYVVIQHFRTRDRDKADAAREFLRTKGISCIVRSGGGDLELVATEGFASEQQAQELVRRILALGKEYWTSGGGYEFTGAKARKF